jgi:formylglycine-generating enzyme required for sulfatase activity
LLFALFSGNYFVQNLFTTSNNSPTSQLTNTPPTNPVAGDPWMQIIDGMTLVFVPAGKFTMGSGENLDQQPIHQVDMDAFWIDQTEVTNNMYAKCVDAGKCDLPNFPLHYYDSSYANHPVVFVSWNDAFAYCFWAHRRLPTEAEWEKAARGTESFFYPWGNESPNSTLLNYNRNVGSTTEVGKYPDGVSVYGALDMAGNVWEWVSSLHKPYPYDASDGRENMDSLEDRVHRGGSWNLSGVSSTYRSSGSPTFSVNVIGFRCAQSP